MSLLGIKGMVKLFTKKQWKKHQMTMNLDLNMLYFVFRISSRQSMRYYLTFKLIFNTIKQINKHS